MQTEEKVSKGQCKLEWWNTGILSFLEEWITHVRVQLSIK